MEVWVLWVNLPAHIKHRTTGRSGWHTVEYSPIKSVLELSKAKREADRPGIPHFIFPQGQDPPGYKYQLPG